MLWTVHKARAATAGASSGTGSLGEHPDDPLGSGNGTHAPTSTAHASADVRVDRRHAPPTVRGEAWRHGPRGRAAGDARRRPERRAGLPRAGRAGPSSGRRGPTTDDPWPPRRTRPRSSAPPTSRSGRSPRSSRGTPRVVPARGARPSLLDDDPEAALRRFATAAERDPSGHALAQSMEVLRTAGLPVEALGLGVGHWRAREHEAEVGRQLVLAAIEADRPLDARHHLESLVEYGDPGASRRCAPTSSAPSPRPSSTAPGPDPRRRAPPETTTAGHPAG